MFSLLQTNQYSKLEKADILEMTVKHLRQLQRQHVTQAISHDPTVASKYKAGVNECANEVVRYLGSLQGVDGQVRERLINHLGNVVSSVNNQTMEYQQSSDPLNVHIPQHVNQTGQSVPSGCLLMPAGSQPSPFVLQSNTPNVSYTTRSGVSSTSPVSHDNNMKTQVCGSFQIVPNSSASGAVAVYLGQSQTVGELVTTSPSQAIPLYSDRSPPRTKASLKAYDQSAFTKNFDEVPQDLSPSSNSSISEKCLPHNLDVQLHNIVGCGRTPSPLKVEDVWRPW